MGTSVREVMDCFYFVWEPAHVFAFETLVHQHGQAVEELLPQRDCHLTRWLEQSDLP